MECRDVRGVADSFLSGQLLTETNHEFLRHLDTCPACRSDVADRRTLRASIRGAYDRAPELQPRSDFASELRERLRETAVARSGRRRSTFGGWWALAATILLAAGVAASFWAHGRASGDLARFAAGDHRDCALKFRLAEKPILLDEAAQRFDAAYRVLQTSPPAEIQTPFGSGRVLERHSCVYRGRRFAHVVIEYRGSVVSLLVTSTAPTPTPVAAAPAPTRSWGAQRDGSLSVVSTSTAGHTIFLVGALDQAELAQLADVVAEPLARRLAGA